MIKANIFVCNDTGLAKLMDQVAATLDQRGHTIVRGSLDIPGERKFYNEQERAELFSDVDAAVFTPRHACTREVMLAAPKLRGICSPVIGVESIDLDAAAELGLLIGNGAVRGNVIGMAESTIMLMLMLLYQAPINTTRIAKGLWRRPGHHASQMEERTIGLIGFGQIAREITKRLQAFNVRIITYSPRAPENELPPGVKKVDLDTLLRESDIVSVLNGLTPKTHHMINADKLALMKSDAYLVNTGRGAIVDESALISALGERQIAGAALDTFEVEPLPADSPLRDLDNVILTPHCVGHTIECWDQFVPAVVENIERMLRNELPLHCKNPEVEPAWRDRLLKITGEKI